MTDLKQQCEAFAGNADNYEHYWGSRDSAPIRVDRLEAFAVAVRKEALEECFVKAKYYRSCYGTVEMLDYSHYMYWLHAQLDQVQGEENNHD